MQLNFQRLSIDVSLEDSQSSSRFDWASLGYGLQQAWVYSVFFDTSLTYLNDVAVSMTSFFSIISVHLFVSILVFSVVLFVCGLLESRISSIFDNSKASITAAIMFSAGTIVLIIPSIMPTSIFLTPVISGVMTGIGSAYYLILWGRRFATLDNDSIIINSAASIVIGFFLYALVIQNLPTEIGVVISGALPLAELFVWNLAKSKSASQKSASDLLKYLPLKRSAVLVRFGIPIALFGLALGFIRTVSTEYITALSSFGATVTIVLTVCAAVLLTIFLYVSLAESSRWNSIFKLIVPCIAVAVFCVPLMYKEPYELTALIVVAGFVLFECIMWIYFGFIAQKFNLSPVLIYGVGRGVLAFFSLVGSIFWQLDTVELLGLNTDVKMSAVLVILIFAYIALPDRRSVEQMRKHALIPKEAPIDLDGEGASAPALAQNEGQIEGVSSGEQASIESSAASLDAPVPANLPPSTSTPSPKIDRMPQQIEVLANTYLLSRREVEVLECLARGHNAAYICKHLYIAEGTAKTHIRHIYRKLNVHSLHELIELVEQTETVIG